ncbi:MAG: hypothetical protein ACYS8W_06850 [Planctomycetota bacterium]
MRIILNRSHDNLAMRGCQTENREIWRRRFLENFTGGTRRKISKTFSTAGAGENRLEIPDFRLRTGRFSIADLRIQFANYGGAKFRVCQFISGYVTGRIFRKFPDFQIHGKGAVYLL